MPFTDNLPASGTKPWYTPFNTVWTNLKTFVNGLETDVSAVESDITGLQAQIDALEPGGAVAWVDVTGKPSSFPPSAHTHVIADVTGLQAELDEKALNSEVVDFVSIVGGQITALSTEVGTKATQSSVDALSAAQTTMAGNLDSTFDLASQADSAAAAAQSDADAALSLADAAQVDADAALSGLATKADTSALPPRAGLNTVGYLGAVWITNAGTVPGGLPADTAVIRRAP